MKRRTSSFYLAALTTFAALMMLFPVIGFGRGAADLLRTYAGRYQLGAGAADVRFMVKVLTGEAIEGRFASVAGQFVIDRRALKRSKIDVTIEPGSVDTGSDQVDGFLKSAGFFDVVRYPTAKFVSTALLQTGDARAEIYGNLTIRGITRQIKLDVELTKPGRRPEFHITGGFYRSKFGMDVGQPIYADLVRLDITASGRRI